MEQPQHIQSTTMREDEPFSLQNELNRLWRSIIFALGYWKQLLLIGIAGALLGIGYSWIKPVNYSARTTFVVEESSKLGGGIASALSGQFGFDIGSLAGGASNGILAGDNVLELVKSRALIRKALLTAYDSANSKNSLADVYADTKKWKKKWEGRSKVGRIVYFPVGGIGLGRTEDSLLQKIETEIISTNLSIVKTDKKLSFFELTVTTGDERLSYLFSRRLLKTATDFYIDTKTRRLSNNVKRLQAKADSLAYALNRKTFSAADENRKLLDINPAYASPEVSAEITSRDKYMQATIYAEIVKNLEISKTALIQETPTIQTVDEPEIPLKDNTVRWWIAALTGAMIAVLLSGITIILRKK